MQHYCVSAVLVILTTFSYDWYNHVQYIVKYYSIGVQLLNKMQNKIILFIYRRTEFENIFLQL